MASSLYYGASPDVNGSRYSSIDGVVALMYKLTINGLKDVLRSEGLPLSGLKAALQARVVQRRFRSNHCADQKLIMESSSQISKVSPMLAILQALLESGT